MTKMLSEIRALAHVLAKPWLLFYALPWLMVLLVFGTVAQRYAGLYQSQKLFFGSFIFWIGLIPLPGAYATIGLIALGLCAKLALKSPLKKRSIGNLITHGATVLLLIGGLVTALSREEGYMVLGPDDSSHRVSDYHQRELAIFKNGSLLEAIPAGELRAGKTVASPALPFSLAITNYCYNCKIFGRKEAESSLRGLAARLDIASASPEKEDAENRTGAVFELRGANAADGVYLTREGLSEQPAFIIGKDAYRIELRQAERGLPFDVRLIKFEKSDYPGTDMARSYRSEVEIRDGALKWNDVIEMNHPLRYRGYTLYQSSFVDAEGKLLTVLAVVKNSGKIFPYLAVTALCIGLMVHLAVTFSRKRTVRLPLPLEEADFISAPQASFKKSGEGVPHPPLSRRERVFSCRAGFVMFLLLLMPLAVLSGDGVNYDNFNYAYFSRIPILHEGRIKPLDSFARVSLKQIYGEKSLSDETAIAWLAHALFEPAEAMQENIFAIHAPEAVSILSLPERPEKLYSFREIAAAFGGREPLVRSLLAKDKKQLSAVEQEIFRLYGNANDFAEIVGTFSLLLPFSGDSDVNYLTAVKSREKINAALKETVKKKGDKIEQYTAEELRDARLSYRMSVLAALDSHNTLVRVIPPSWEGTEEWRAPWAVIEQGAGSPTSVALFHDWEQLAKAWNAHDATAWNALAEKIYAASAGSAGVRPFALSLEVAYNAFDPLGKSMMLYTLAVLVTCAAVIRRSGRLESSAFLIILMGAAIHAAGLAIRMAILARPPVSTLYESMIFVSFMTAAFGVWLEQKRRDGQSLLVSGIIAGLLIAAANVFAADSDTLEVLVAVLNTNFWLGTHVVCITTGYASALLAGAIAHVYLVRRALGAPPEALAALQRRLHHVALVALLFTTIGTMLGGIWADQSWGRFWGWDPKENGALLIVLWLIWMLHGRIAGQVHDIGFACGMAFTTIVVALAWVGVNLLSVGLHSYGFTNTAATGLLAFCAMEIVFIASATIFASRRHYAPP